MLTQDQQQYHFKCALSAIHTHGRNHHILWVDQNTNLSPPIIGLLYCNHRRSFTFLPGGAPTGRPWALIFYWFFYTPYIPFFIHFQLFIAYIFSSSFKIHLQQRLVGYTKSGIKTYILPNVEESASFSDLRRCPRSSLLIHLQSNRFLCAVWKDRKICPETSQNGASFWFFSSLRNFFLM